MRALSTLAFLAVLTLPSALLAEDPAPEQAGLVDVETAPLRMGPAAEESVLETLPKGTEISVFHSQGDWTLVKTRENRLGWVRTTDVKTNPTAQPTVEPAAAALLPEPTPPPLKEESVIKQEPPRPEQKLGTQKEPREFAQLSLMIQPGLDFATSAPSGMDDRGFSIGAQVAWYLLPYLGLHLPYAYHRYSSNTEVQTAGVGPILRYVDLGWMRGAVAADGLYVRAARGNHLGWGAGWDLTFGFQKVPLQPFIGPFFRFERIYLPGPDIDSMNFGIGLTLTNLADF